MCVCKQLAAFFSEQLDEMSSWMSMHRYYTHMMRCIADQMEHEVHVSLYAYQHPGDEKLTATLNVPDDVETTEHESPDGMTSSGDLGPVFPPQINLPLTLTPIN